MSDNTDYNLVISGSNIGLSAGVWSGWSNSGAGGATSAMFNPAVEGPGTYNIMWTVVNADGDCMMNETASTTIFVDGDNSGLFPTATFFPSVGCVGVPTQITAFPTAPTFSTPIFNYTIDTVNTDAPGAQVDANGMVTASGPGNVVVFITETNGCGTSLPLSLTIPFAEGPDLIATPSTDTLPNGFQTGIGLNTTYFNPGVVQFWLTDISFSSPDVQNPGSTLVPGPVGDVNTSFFLPGAVLNETLTNAGNAPQTATYTFVPTRQDGNGCAGDPVMVIVTVMPTPNLSISANQTLYCSGETPDFSISTATMGGGVTFDLVIDELEDPVLFPADLEDDQTFPIIIPELVATVGGTLEVSDLAIFVLNRTGSFDPGRIVLGMQNIRLTDYPVSVAPPILPAPTPDQTAIIFPEPVLTPLPDIDICSGENVALDLSLLYPQHISSYPTSPYPVRVEWTVETTTNDAGISGAMSGQTDIYDASGTDLSFLDISQTLTNTGTVPETATYKIVPISAGWDGQPGTAADCAGDTIYIKVSVNPELVVQPMPANAQTCSGSAFMVEMTSNTTPINGMNDLEFLVSAITNTPNLGQGNSVIPNVTVLQNGQFLTETLVNTTGTPQTVIYTLRPQLNTSRTNPNDPTTATCVGAEVTVSVEVFPTPSATVQDNGATPFCAGDAKTVEGMPVGNGPFTHLWEIAAPQPAGFTGTGTLDGGQSTTNAVATFTGDAPGMIQLKYTATDANGCTTDPQLLEFEITARPTVEILGGDQTICIEDGPLSLTAIPTDDGASFFTDAPAGLTDFGDGTASFDPDQSGAGVFHIIMNYAPQNACGNSDTIQVTVEKCTPEITITDPCSCRENPVGSQGNATTLENGQFIETVQVTAPTNQTWYIADVVGLYDVASPHPPSPLIPFQTGPAGDTLVQQPAGIFTLQGVHVDDIGYEIKVTNGTDTLSISNKCAYPNPVIESLKGGYCANAAPVPLVGHAGTSTGTGQFDIFKSNGVLVHANATELNPAMLGTGTFTVQYTFDEDDQGPCQNCNPGCVQSVGQVVKIVPKPGAMTCNDMVNISLDDDCEVVVHPDMVLEGNFPSYDIFSVEIYDGSLFLGDTVRGPQIGKVLTVRVYEECGNNYCWGNLKVEDKQGPVFIDCTDTIRVACTAPLDAIAPPTVADNCDGILTPTLLGTTQMDFGCGNGSGVVRRVLRVWRATDSQGNVSQPCYQVIEMEEATLADVVFPPNFDDLDQPAMDCAAFDTDPATTGWPTIAGFPIDSANACSINVLYQDQVIQICEGSFKVIRTWTVFDWCTPSGPNNPLTHKQIIKILDTTPPAMTCPPDLTVGMLNDCTAFGSLPPATITDDCSSFTVMVVTPNGNIAGNGGLITGLPMGAHLVTWEATDNCGNTSTCQTTITVEDNVPPTPICDELTIVSLNSNGQTFNSAISFDDGSYDNCPLLPITFEAKRMDDPGDFADKVGFDCSDVGTPVPVIVRLTDYFGNQNTCMVTVNVQSKNSPLIACPPPVTIDCQDDINDFNLTLQPTISGNCQIISNLPTDEYHIDNICGTGFVLRKWTAVDQTGQSASCTQMITITDKNAFDGATIEWPADTTITGCQSMFEIEPQNLPASPVNYKAPIINYLGCGIGPVASHLDQYFIVTDSACFKVIRKWTVIDWCQHVPNDPNSPGIWEYEQVIKIIDTEAPVLSNCEDRTFNNPSSDCSPIVVDLSIQVEDCADSLDLNISWVVDEFNDGTNDASGLGMNTSNAYPNGTHRIQYSVNDKCGNTSTCSFLFTITDSKKPTITCGPINIEIMPQAGMIEVPVTHLIYGISDNCTDTTDLRVSYSADVNDTTRLFTCDNIGLNNVEIWVTDLAGNNDFCVAQVDIQDNMNVCDTALVVISGGTYDEEDNPVNGVGISVNGGNVISTDANGIFVFDNLPAGGDYTLVPKKDDDLLNGVTTYDMALISKHILNIKKLDSPYKIIAADVNGSGTVTTMDLVALRKAILHMSDEFPNNYSWRFVENTYAFPDPANPFLETFPEYINYNNLAENISNADFVAVKIGDVNNSANLRGETVENRDNGEPLIFQMTDRVLEPGQENIVELYVPEVRGLDGFQFTLHFDPEQIQVIEPMDGGLMETSNWGLRYLSDGIMLASWHDNVVEEKAGPQLVTRLRVIASQKTRLRNVLKISSEIIRAEAYITSREETFFKNVTLNISEKWTSTPSFITQN
ncbi:MAG: hypothetical protein D6714_01350, partial [Bacteroidetes bacterium]